MASDAPPGDGQMLTRIILEIFRLNGRFVSVGDAMTKDIGLTTARWQILGAISLSRADVTVSMVARLIGLQRQSVQRVVGLLVQDGLIALEKNPHHRKAPILRLTLDGKRVYEIIDARQKKWASELAIREKDYDLNNIFDFLKSVRVNLGDDGPSLQL